VPIGFSHTPFDPIAPRRALQSSLADDEQDLYGVVQIFGFRIGLVGRRRLIQNFEGKHFNILPLFEQCVDVVFEPQDFAFIQRSA